MAHAPRSDPFDVFMGRTFSRTGHSIDTRMVAAGEGAIVGFRVGLAAGPTDDRSLSQAFIISLAELQTFFHFIFWRRLPGLSFLRDEVRHLSRTTRNTFHGHTTDFMSQTPSGSIRLAIERLMHNIKGGEEDNKLSSLAEEFIEALKFRDAPGTEPALR